MMRSISPLDGRYRKKLQVLTDYFSEYALFKYRLLVEVEYLIQLTEELPQISSLSANSKESLRFLVSDFNEGEAERIKQIEQVTNHDVKAVEYYLKEKLEGLGLSALKEFVHFGLTSQDINNTATPMLLRDFTIEHLIPKQQELLDQVLALGMAWKAIPMLARTHGQAASPTTLGKEFLVFHERLNLQLQSLNTIRYSGKFGGATGNFNAHHAAYPGVDWPGWANVFLKNKLGLERQQFTTQIAHYDEIAAWCHQLIRTNTILLDFCRDLWTYISMDYFKQKTREGEVGSSAMPHKVNPIDFENAEGNLGLSTALAGHLAEKLPISRLQRDLTDSTVLRNLGVPIAHHYLAILSIQNGMQKLVLNEAVIKRDLEQQWVILAEAIQTVLRREGYENPYEALKDLTRGKGSITQAELHAFIDQLRIPVNVKEELKTLRPETYIGPAL
ncbi:MAG TPA: adenylosuccinate lyase [Saprospiraceae bacterium]|nr:adenylosuccinate lyase [Saprospiraceae bacterium]